MSVNTQKSLYINTLEDNKRMSSQELMQEIDRKIKEGYTEFDILASGQHNIGGTVWNDNKDDLTFRVKNPGQRVGSMGMSHTKIIVEGSVPADTGWLNSGAKIIVKGDAGDTAGHCAASGKIFVSGNVGTRSGALMKKDPKFSAPELWVLKGTGSFSFEFMGGGIAVVCGYGLENSSSVIGYRSCVGMVGGTVYVRGNTSGLANDVEVCALSNEDIEFLSKGLVEFLDDIEKKELINTLSDFAQWKKILPKPYSQEKKGLEIKNFRQNEWIEGGIFSSIIDDNAKVTSIIETGENRINIPVWSKEINGKKCINCKICLNNCPQYAIKIENEETENFEYTSNPKTCIGCGICAGVCPCKTWAMTSNL